MNTDLDTNTDVNDELNRLQQLVMEYLTGSDDRGRYWPHDHYELKALAARIHSPKEEWHLPIPVREATDEECDNTLKAVKLLEQRGFLWTKLSHFVRMGDRPMYFDVLNMGVGTPPKC